MHQFNTHIWSGQKGTLARGMSRPGKAPTTAPRHTKGRFARGNTHNRPSAHKGALAQGMTRPGKAPISAPLEVLSSHGTHGFGNLPKDRPGLGETTYTTSEPSLCTNGVLLPNTQVGRVPF